MRSIAHGFGEKMALLPNLFDIKLWGKEEEGKGECGQEDCGQRFKVTYHSPS